MIIQNLKVAFRNLMKYKVQTLLSIASIAIGIVTLSLAFSVMTRFRLPSIMSQPFKDRAYEVHFRSTEGGDSVPIDKEAIRALKRDNGLRHAEMIAVLKDPSTFLPNVEFHLMDSTTRSGVVPTQYFDPEYVVYSGMRSAITGEKIRKLRKGEALISEKYAKKIFQDANPIGAVQKLSNYAHSFPVTIVDVCEEASAYDPHFKSVQNKLLLCVEENVEDYENYFDFEKVYVVLKEGSTEQELKAEMNGRLKPFNQEVKLSKALDNQDIRRIVGIHILVYITGSLLLLAAIIGYLRMQIQLFWMRRSEISLRIVNGAKRIQIFSLLVTDVLITVLLSSVLSVILGYMLEDFLDMNLGFFDYYDLTIENLWLYSLVIAVVLIIMCSVLAWIIIRRVAGANQGLARNMRRSRNHVFRNVMLGVQITVGIVFVSLTFILINDGKELLDVYNVPGNDSFYKKCILVKPWNIDAPERLVEEIGGLPDIDRTVSWVESSCIIQEVQKNEKAKETFNYPYMDVINIPDTTMLSFLGIEVEWFNRDIDRGNCILIGEDYYGKFKELGLLENNTLSYDKYDDDFGKMCFPIAGIIKRVPYYKGTYLFAAISPVYDKNYHNRYRCYLLIPGEGREKALARSVQEALERVAPGRIELKWNEPIQNYRTERNEKIDTVETVTTLGWILGIVSVIICSMSILSTIMLDTRSRRKEAAIRKINGAKSIDIYRLFGRVYIVLLVLAVIVAIPVCVMFNGFVESYVKDNSTVEGFSPLWPVVLGISIVAVLILAIVGWQTHKMLRIDPAKIIAKE